MKLIIKESQLNNTITKLIKMEGWEKTGETLGLSPKEFMEQMFDGNPMDFLNIYNDLDVVQSEEKPDCTLFRYEKGDNLMVYSNINKIMGIDVDNILSFLIESGFEEDAADILIEWLSNTFEIEIAGFAPLLISKEWI